MDITPVPYSRTVTQAEFNAGTYGTAANEVWFRLITTAANVLGGYNSAGGTFIADASVYESDGSTLVIAHASGTNSSWNAILATAGTYYVKVTRHGGGASNFDFTSQFDTRPLDGFTIPESAFIVNDDTSGNPASIVTIDGTIHGYLSTVPSGEIGAMLPDGTSLWYDPNGDLGTAYHAVLVTAAGAFVSSIDIGFSPVPGSGPVFTASDTHFYVVSRNDGTVREFTSAGVDNGVVATLDSGPTFSDLSCAGINADGTLLYWANGKAAGGNQSVVSHDIATDTSLGVLWTLGTTANYGIGVTCNGHPGDLVVLPDGTFVTFSFDETNQPTSERMNLYHVSAAGSVLDSKVYDDALDTFCKIDHLCKASNGSSTIGLWIQDLALERGTFAELAVSGWTTVNSFDTDHFEGLEDLVANSATLFAPSQSCTFFRFPASSSSGGNGAEIECLHGSHHGTITLSGSAHSSLICSDGSSRSSMSGSGSSALTTLTRAGSFRSSIALSGSN